MISTKDILDNCCGLDIHKDTIVACLMKEPVNQQPSTEIRTFSTLNHDIESLRNWLETQDCRHVAMESTGIYWQPVFTILELAFDGDMSLIVVNARHMKNVPGKKTDMKDAECAYTGLSRRQFRRHPDIKPETSGHLINQLDFTLKLTVVQCFSYHHKSVNLISLIVFSAITSRMDFFESRARIYAL